MHAFQRVSILHACYIVIISLHLKLGCVIVYICIVYMCSLPAQVGQYVVPPMFCTFPSSYTLLQKNCRDFSLWNYYFIVYTCIVVEIGNGVMI